MAPRQLEMRLTNLDSLPDLDLPSGVTLRSYQPGDESAWACIMNHCVDPSWTAERCQAELIRRDEFNPGGCFFAVVDGVPQGTATAWQKRPERGETGYVHMVGVAPAYRGRGLGRLATLAVLHWFREKNYRRVVLHTDDWRLPAVRTYLRLGFEPVLFDAHHAQRWERVRAKLMTQA